MSISRTLLCVMVVISLGTAVKGMPFEKGRKDFSVITGFGQNHRFPSATKSKLKFDVADLRWGKFSSNRSQKAIELCVGNMVDSDDNLIVCTTASHRRYFMVKDKTALAWELGIGLAQLEHRVPELGSKLNFTEQAGIVLQRKLNRSAALTLNYKFFHISNAGLSKPNVGLNSSMVTVGYTQFR
ncbi:MAG: acyloxyacyl hydrolase [Armatimonadota bacterium]|jgi:hypothetical protein